MSLTNCIIHHIERPAPGNDVAIATREQENNSVSAAHSLFEQLKQSFQRSSQKQYGHFDRELSDNPLPQWVKEQQSNKASFASISLRMMEHLQQLMGNNDEVFSSHILFALENVLEQDVMYIFWINHIDANHIDASLDVASARFVDPSKLQYAAKIYITEWLEQDSQKYLALLSARGNKTLSDSLIAFVGYANGIDIVEETSEFLGILDQYTESLPEEKTTEYKGRILDYCVEQDKHGRPVVFDEISTQLDESSPKQFSDFVSEKQQTPKAEIYTDRSSLKRYVRYFGRDKDMSISFSADRFGEDIIYDPQSGSLTIKRIPKSLRQQLLKNKTQTQTGEPNISEEQE
jgi:nucleoid-associated protein